jgi:hypothetical protein
MPTIETLTVDVRANTSKLSSGLKTAGLAIGALAAGAALSFRAWEESEQVANQTGAVIKSTGSAANVTAAHVANLASELSKKAGVDDEVIQSGQNMLLTFKNIRNEAGAGNDVFDQATTTLLDMATAMGTEPKQAAIQLGKALNDPIAGLSALSRVGVTFTAQQQKQITALQEGGDLMGAQKIILAELASEFEGSAEAQKTASGSAAVAFGNLQEALGGVVAAGMTPLIAAAMPVIDFLARSPGLTAALIVGITGLVVAYKLWHAWTLLSIVAQKALLAAMPWALIAIAVIALVVIIVKNWDTIKTVILAAWNAIKAASVAVWNAVKAVVVGVWNAIVTSVTGSINRIKSVIGAVKGFIVGVWNTIKGVATGVWNAIRDTAISAFSAITSFFAGVINGIISGLNAAIRGINLVKPGSDIPSIAPLADGGLVTRPTLALVGERGPEVVIPLDRLAGLGGAPKVSVGVRLDRRRFSDDLDYGTEYRGWA